MIFPIIRSNKGNKVVIGRSEYERFNKKHSCGQDCWEWTGHLVAGQYGQFMITGVRLYSHVVSYLIHKGDIEDDAHVCHKCDVPWCVNPAHLWLGTHIENMRDCDEKGRRKRGSQHPRSLLSEKEVLEMRAMREFGFTNIEICAAFPQFKKTAIVPALNRRTWKHIK